MLGARPAVRQLSCSRKDYRVLSVWPKSIQQHNSHKKKEANHLEKVMSQVFIKFFLRYGLSLKKLPSQRQSGMAPRCEPHSRRHASYGKMMRAHVLGLTLQTGQCYLGMTRKETAVFLLLQLLLDL